MDNLEIKRESSGDEMILICTGRLDSNNAGHLKDYFDRLVREGQYHISIDMTGIDYISSAGIRSLLILYKNLKAVNGHFHIASMSDNVKEVLEMVGMLEMLSQLPQTLQSPGKEETDQQFLEAHQFKFELEKLSPKGATNISWHGQPELTMNSGFETKHTRLVKAQKNHFALGLGAIGESFEESKNRFGEYIMLGKNIAYLPADGSKKPDYMVSSGQLVASLSELYGLHFEGNFSHLVKFNPTDSKTTIGLSDLATDLQQLTGLKKMAIVMLAESGGLIGTSLNKSPVDGNKIFTFPEIKDSVNFTTEPTHTKMLSLSVGYLSFEKEEEMAKFIRPMKPDSALNGHVHSAVFPYVPLKKTEIDLAETIDYLFNNAELTDLLHLTNDTREIVGLGESQFVQGFCWIVPIESINQISNH